jgi:hypothetical protein
LLHVALHAHLHMPYTSGYCNATLECTLCYGGCSAREFWCMWCISAHYNKHKTHSTILHTHYLFVACSVAAQAYTLSTQRDALLQQQLQHKRCVTVCCNACLLSSRYCNNKHMFSNAGNTNQEKNYILCSKDLGMYMYAPLYAYMKSIFTSACWTR